MRTGMTGMRPMCCIIRRNNSRSFLGLRPEFPVHLPVAKLARRDSRSQEAGADLHFRGGDRGHGLAGQHPGGAGVPGQHHQLQQGGELPDAQRVRAESDQGEGVAPERHRGLQAGQEVVPRAPEQLCHSRWKLYLLFFVKPMYVKPEPKRMESLFIDIWNLRTKYLQASNHLFSL